MKMINHLREFYGFPQAVLARYVGVSRGHLSMAAIGRKDLQTAAFLKLCKFALAEKNVGDPELEHIKANHCIFIRDKSAGFVKHKILETQHRLMGCQRKLHRMQIKHCQAIHALACLGELQANPEDPDIAHYKVMEMSTREVLDKNSEAAQLELELRIVGLQATAEFLRQRVAARENLAASQGNPGAANISPVRALKIFAGVQTENKSEAKRVDPAPLAEKLEAKAASLQAKPAVEGSMAVIPANPEDLHMNQDELTGIAPGRGLDKNSEVTAFDLELQTNGLNNRGDFSRGKLRLHMHHRQRGKTMGRKGEREHFYNDYKIHTIPHIIVVDKKGGFVQYSAPYPSRGDELEKLIIAELQK